MSTRPHARSLLEREAEVAALHAMVDATSGGDGRLVAVEGNAGIGKTRLLGEARDLAHHRDFEVLTARGGEFESEFAFGIVRQLFEPTLAVASPESRQELLSGAAELAAPVVLGTPVATAAGVGAEASFATLHGLYWLAANFALRRPSLLVVDDLHWADDPSLRWLGYLARRLEGLPLLVVVAMRPPGQARAPALLAELLADPGAVVIRPGELGRESTAMLARELLGLEPDPEFAAALHTASGGNPLYVGALLDAVARDGISPTGEHAPRLLALGPEAVSQGVVLSLGRLPGEAIELALAAAVLGDGTGLHLAAALAGLDARAAGRAATSLVHAGLLRREEPLEFVHPVVRTAVYEGAHSGDRLAARRRAAEILLESGAPPEQAAAHLLHSLPSGDPFVTTTLRRAARRALAQGAPEAAVAHLRRALAEPPGEELAGVLGELGSAEQLVDVAAAIEHLTEAVALTTDPTGRAEHVLEQSRVLWLAGRPSEAVEVLRTELGRPGAAPPDLRERLLADLVGGSMWDPDLHQLAVEQLAGIDEDELHGGLGSDCLLAVLGELELQRGVDRDRAVTLAERALASGRLVRERALALFSVTGTLFGAGELDTLSVAVEAALGAGRRAGDIPGITALVQTRALVAAQRGDLVTAEADVAEALEIARAHGLTNTLRYSGAFAATIAVERGRLGDAEALLTSLGPLTAELPSPHLSFLLDARGRLRLAQQQAEGALADFMACGAILDSLQIANAAHTAWQSRASLALHALGRSAEARRCAAEEVERARRWGAPRPLGIALRALGLVEGGEAGADALREAIAVLSASPARLELARVLVDLGASLRRGNRRSEARELLRQGVELAHRCGATPLVERANEELAATGARPRKLVLTGLESLTASERRVAQLAAEELSNKEIAQALFVTVKTVEVHLSSVYRKLEIGSRRHLAGALVGPQAAQAVPAAC